MKRLSAKFHLAMGLTSIVTSVILLAVMLNLVPDRRQAVVNGRVVLAESIASSSTLFLANEDYSSVAENLEFSIERNPELLAATIKRQTDEAPLNFGDATAITDDTSQASTERRVVLPILQDDAQWGEIVLYFESPEGSGWVNYLRHSRFALIAFAGLICFALFYLYLGRMLKALNPSQAVPGRVRSALDTLAEALLVIDRKSNVVLANKAFQEITGQTGESILGKNASAFEWHLGDVHPDERSDDTDDKNFPWLVALQNKETLRGEPLWLQDHQGEWHKFLVNCSPIITGKTANGVLISLDDITELEEKEQELRLARDAAEQANHAKTSFLSNMSHEIRTPMTAILGFTEVLKRGTGKSDTNWQKHLNTISSSGQHLLELINDVLDLSKVESGALEIENIECKPYMVAHDVVQVLNVRAEEKSIGLDIVVPEPLPETITSDSSRLRQIITNLVGNAIKFTETGGVQIILRTEQQDQETMLAIDVVDSGIGMNKKQLGAIFKPFVQADSSITRRFGGTGLGLAISKKLAGALGGDITVTSEMNVGTTFTAKVKTGSLEGVAYLTPEMIQEKITQSDDAHETVQWEFPPSKILVIDDAAENRELITLVLTDLGLESDTAENGAIGVQMAHDNQYDIIMSDIQMPVMDGYETAKTLRANGLKQPIIALTANAMKGYEERILDSGFSHYMTKPIDLDALTRLLGELLGGQSSVVEVSEVDTASSVATEPPTATVAAPDNGNTEQTPIYSRMGSSETLGHVVEQFIDKLQVQLPKIEEAGATKNYTELAALAHWLKGSGGTVGFDALFEPAKALEGFAEAGNDAEIAVFIDQIKSIAARLRAGSPTDLVDQNQQISNDTQPQLQALHTQGSSSAVDKPVESRLAEKNPAFRPIILRFVSRLDSQIEKLEQAIAQDEFTEIANLAHWLKGSGGTVGFDVFTEPAAEMELYAKKKNKQHMETLLNQIKTYASNIVIPGNDSDSTDKKNSA